MTGNKVDIEVGKNEEIVNKSLISGWRWLWGIVVTVFIAWVPFYGYTFLITELAGAGFDGADVDPKVYDLVFYFLLGWADPINTIFEYVNSVDIVFWLLRTLLFGALIGFLLVVLSLILIFFSIGEKPVQNGKRKTLIDRFTEIMTNPMDSFKNLFLLFFTGFAFASVIAVVEVFALLIFLVLGASLWLLSLTGYISGLEEGKDIVSDKICEVQHEWKDFEKEQGFFHGCSEIKIEKKMVAGKRVYSDKNSTFFVTNKGSYQVNNKGEILYFRPITRLKKVDSKAESTAEGETDE